ncbi:MAG TPA: mandelate racemase/muconate lactonizing enzyme family protein [Stellaceae bacterium]|nr:mandelate racemase/muconate lactonizing enzyme family protein [Stellaceae bacterium]
MKITRLEPILIAIPYRHGGPIPEGGGAPWRTMDTQLLRVETDAGLTGWGEAFGFGACPATKTATERLVAPLAIGRDPRDIAALMTELARKLHNFGRNGPVSFALSGLDIALWDIAGKIAGAPLHRLLGGSGKGRVPAYASLLRYGAADLVARNAAAAVERGYRQIKLHEIGIAEIAAGRRAIGAEIALMLDANCAWPADEAVAMARRLRENDLLWLEEPVWPPEDHHGLARVRRDGGIAVAAGENAGTPAEFEHLIDRAAVDYLQPSVTKVGGISAMQRIIAHAESRGVAVAPHSPYFGPGLIATLHLIAASPLERVCERFYCDLEASPFGDAVEARGGFMRVPSGAGLGVAIDERVIARYRTG